MKAIRFQTVLTLLLGLSLLNQSYILPSAHAQGAGDPVVWKDLVMVTAVGNTIAKNAGGNAWNAGAGSTSEIIGDGGVDFLVPDALSNGTSMDRMCGLSNSNPDADFDTIGYAIYLAATSEVYIYENGLNIGALETYTYLDRFQVIRTGSTVEYQKNDVTFYTSTVPSSGSLVVDTSIFTQGGTVDDVFINGGTLPANIPPIADDQDVTVVQNRPTPITLTATDPEGFPLTYIVETGPTNGSLSGTAPDLTYTPDPGYTGLDSFTFYADDGTDPGNTATVSITVVIPPTPVTWIDPVGVDVTGNNLEKTAVTGWGNSGAASLRTIPGDGGVGMGVADLSGSVIEDDTWRMIGLSPSNTDANYTSITYGLLLSNIGQLEIWELGQLRGRVDLYNSDISNRVSVTRTGTTVEYQLNDVTFYTSAISSSGDLVVDAALYTQGATIFDANIVGGVLPPNNPPIADDQNVTVIQDTPTPITLTATDPEMSPLTYAVISGPSNGQLSGTAPNLTYAPDPGYTGPDSFTFIANDGTDDSNLATITINVVLPGMGPQPVVWTDLVGVSVNGNTIQKVGGVANKWDAGAASTGLILGNGGLDFLADVVGTDRIAGLSNTNTDADYVTIDYAIYLSRQGGVYVYESSVPRGLLESYIAGDRFQVVRLGTTVEYRKNDVTFYTSTVPSTGPLVVDSSIWTMGGTVVDVLIDGATPAPNNPPVAEDQNATVIVNTPRPITLVATDADMDPLAYTVESDPNNGTLSGTAPNLTYTPNSGFVGPDSFTFSANDGTDDSNTATVTINVVSTAETFGVFFDDPNFTPTEQAVFDVDTQLLVFQNSLTINTITTDPGEGSENWEIIGTGAFFGMGIEHTPAARDLSQYEGGFLHFMYKGTSGGFRIGVQSNVGGTIEERFVHSSDLVQYGLIQDGQWSSVNIPMSEFTGVDLASISFSFIIIGESIDGYTPGDTHYIDGLWWSQGFSTPFPEEPVAQDQNVSTTQDTPLDITLVARDFNRDPLTYSYTQPPNGLVTGTGPDVTYTPDAGFSGQDTFTFTANDGDDTSNTATVTVSVVVQPVPVVWTDLDGVSVNGNTITKNGGNNNVWDAGAASSNVITANGGLDFRADGTNTHRMGGLSDINTDAGYASIDYAIYLAVGGDVYVYESGADLGRLTNYVDQDRFQVVRLGTTVEYRKNDVTFYTSTVPSTGALVVDSSIWTTGGTVADALIEGAGPPPNNPPVANDQLVTVIQDTGRGIILTADDVEGSPLTYNVISGPSNGGLSGTAPNLTYTPNGGYTGADSFTFRANDGDDDSNIATVTIDVIPAVALQTFGIFFDDPNFTPTEQAVFDVDTQLQVFSSSATINSLTTDPGEGSENWEIIGTGAFFGIGIAHQPVTRDLSAYAGGYLHVMYKGTGGGFRIGIQSNVSGVIEERYVHSSDLVQYGLIQDGQWSSVNIPMSEFAGVDFSSINFSFIITGDSADGYTPGDTHYIDGIWWSQGFSTPFPEEPVAQDQSVTTQQDTPIDIMLVATDFNRDPLTYSYIQPSNGVVTGTGPDVTYTPNAGFFGQDSFTFTANDGDDTSNTATVTVSVATPPTPIVWTDAVGVIVTGNSLEKDVATGWGNSGAASPNIIPGEGGVDVRADILPFPQPNTWRMIGLSPSNTDENYTTITYGLGLTDRKELEIWELGAKKGVFSFSSYVDGSRVSINRVGSVVEYRLNGNTFYTSTIPSSGDLVVDVALYTQGATITDALIIGATPAPNNPPVANDQFVTVIQDTGRGIILTADDVEGSPLTYNVISGPSNGGLSGVAPNLTYTPNGGYTGADSFTFRANDGDDDSNIATVTIDVIPAVALQTFGIFFDDPTFTPTEQAVFDVDTQLQVFSSSATINSLTTDPGEGSENWEIIGTGAFFGIGIAHQPVTRDLSAYEGGYLHVMYKGTSGGFRIGIQSDVSGVIEERYVHSSDLVQYGLIQDGQWSSVNIPMSEFAGVDFSSINFSFIITGDSGDGYTPGDTHYIDGLWWSQGFSTPFPEEPVAQDQNVSTTQDTPVDITLVATDFNRDPLTYSYTQPSNGVVTGTGPDVTYTPNGGFFGQDTFTFTANDGDDTSNTATVTVSVAVPPVPVVWTDLVNVSVNGNTITKNDGTNNVWDAGAASTDLISGDGGLDFRADGTNTHRMGGLSDINTDAGYASIDYAIYLAVGGDVYVYESGADLGRLTNYVDQDRFQVVRLGTTVEYRKNDVTFYTSTVPSTGVLVVDSSIWTTGGTVADALIEGAGAPPNNPPVANDQFVTVIQDTGRGIILTADDVEGSPLTYNVVSGPSNGGLSGTAPNLTYTPNGGYTGPDSFTFVANDGDDDSNIATVTIDVIPAGALQTFGIFFDDPNFTPTEQAVFDVDTQLQVFSSSATINSLTTDPGEGSENWEIIGTGAFFGIGIAHQPVTRDLSAYAGGYLHVMYKGTGGGFRIGIQSNVSGVIEERYVHSSDLVQYGLIQDGQWSSVNIPMSEFAGVDFSSINFSFIITGDSADGYTPGDTHYIDGIWWSQGFSTPFPEEPVAQDQSVTTQQDTPIDITLVATDFNRDPLTYSYVQPSNGVVTGTGPDVTYTPNGGFFGQDTFTFTANDGDDDSNTATVTVSVAAPLLPVVWTDAEGVIVNGNSLEKDVGTGWANSGAASTNIITGDGGVDVRADETNTWRMIGLSPSNTDADYTTITYGLGLTDSNTLEVWELGSPKGSFGPFMTGNRVSIDRVGSVVEYRLNGTAFYTSTIPSSGDLVVDVALFTGPTLPNPPGPPGATIDDALISGSTPPPNNPPVAEDQSVTAIQDTPRTIILEVTDLEMSPLTYTVESDPSNGLLGGTAPNLTYTPNTGYTGPDSFTFSANDGSDDSNIATVTIDVVASAQTFGIFFDDPTFTPTEQAVFEVDTELFVFSNSLTIDTIITNPGEGQQNWEIIGTGAFFGLGIAHTPVTRDLSAYEGGYLHFLYRGTGGGFRIGIQSDTAGVIEERYVHSSDLVQYGLVQDGEWSSVNIPMTEFVGIDFSNIFYSFVIVGDTDDGYTPGDTHYIDGLWWSQGFSTPFPEEPVARDQNVTAEQDTAVNITLSAIDINRDPLTYTYTQPANGVVTGTAPNVTYTPNTGFTGIDTFTFFADDGDGSGNIGIVTVSVLLPPAPVQWTDTVGVDVNGNTLTKTASNGWGNSGAASTNVIPGDGSVDVRTDETTTWRMIGLSPMNTDADFPTITYGLLLGASGRIEIWELGTQIQDPPVDGLFDTYSSGDRVSVHRVGNLVDYRLNGTSFYTSSIPSSGDLVVDAALFTFVSSPPLAATIADALISGVVPPGNTPPVAQDQNVTVIQDTPKAITLVATDVDMDALTYNIESFPVNGTLSGTAPDLIYTSAPGFSGPDSFTFSANDGTDDSNIATVSIDVLSSVQTFGIFFDDPDFTPTDQAIFDVDTQVFVFDNSMVINLILGNGGEGSENWEFIGTGAFMGMGIASTPVLKDMSQYSSGYLHFMYRGTAGGFRIGISSNNGQEEQFISSAQLAQYGLFQDGDWCSVNIPMSEFAGVDFANIFYYLLFVADSADGYTPGDTHYIDGLWWSQDQSFPLSEAPVAQDQTLSIPQDTPVNITLEAVDANRDPLTYTYTQPVNGTVTGTAPDVTYTPNTGFAGLDTFSFFVNDGDDNSNLAIVNINVQGPPTAVTWIDIVGAQVTGNVLEKTTITQWANSGAASLEIIPGDGGVDVGVIEDDTWRMIGLSPTNTDEDFRTITYGLGLSFNQEIEIWELGVDRGTYSTYQSGDRVSINRVGNTVEYRQNGVPFYTSAIPSSGDLIVDVALYSGTNILPPTVSGPATVFDALIIGGISPGNYSISRIQGNQLIVEERLPSGQLASPVAYKIKGVDYSLVPALPGITVDYENFRGYMRDDQDNNRSGDLADIALMGANTIRTYVDFGIDQTALNILDEAHANGLKVLMSLRTLDFASGEICGSAMNTGNPNYIDNEVLQVVQVYRNHPALLGWLIGNEWNLNAFDCYTPAQNQQMRNAVALTAEYVKTLDPNHVVASSLGFLADEFNNTPDLLSLIDPVFDAAGDSVDLWTFNLYRGDSFDPFFLEWNTKFPNRPFAFTEFGTDSYDDRPVNPPGDLTPIGENGDMQVATALSLWDEIHRNLSANDATRQVVGGFIFEYNDEWWKAAGLPNQQDTGGFVIERCFDDQPLTAPGTVATCFQGHPDGFANEEYFGIVDINRDDNTSNPPNPEKKLFTELQAKAFNLGWLKTDGVMLAVNSQGGSVDFDDEAYVFFEKNDYPLVFKYADIPGNIAGGRTTGPGRGLNFVILDRSTGSVVDVQNRQPPCFDGSCNAGMVTYCTDLFNYVNGLTPGDIAMVGAADTGINEFFPIVQLDPVTGNCYAALELLGSTQAENIDFREPWALISIVGDSGITPATLIIESGGTVGETIEVTGTVFLDYDRDNINDVNDLDNDNDSVLDVNELSNGTDLLDPNDF